MKSCDCGNHPTPCFPNGLFAVVGLIGIGVGFGLRWACFALFVCCELDWLIRVWKVRPLPPKESAE
jgi:hypothetical protein